MRKVLLSLLVALSFALTATAQDRVITGKITDDRSQPVSGVSVVPSDGRGGTQTDGNGNYKVTVSSTARSITFSRVGFTTMTLPVSGSTLNATLISSSGVLDDVVVTGYTVKTKPEFTGASAKVMSKEIEQVPIASFEQILQGRAPGLYIASGSGQPGASARVNIRGVGSISGGSEPLYILDGIPIESGVFRSLNPNDFETVDVLKDASGAGLYGSRGANGVIVITSKKGKVGKTLLQYRGQVGFSEPPSLTNVQLMNTDQRLQYEEEFLGPSGIINALGTSGFPGWDFSQRNPSYASQTPAEQARRNRLLDSVRQINTNWADILFRRSTFQQHELNASGGSEGINFFSSLSTYKQQGILDRSNLDRYTFRTNVDFKTNRLTASLRSFAGYSINSGIESENAVALANPVAAAFLELPYRRLTNPQTGKTDVGAGRTGANAYDRTRTTTSLSAQFKGNLGITLQYKIWKGISLKTTNGVDYRNNNQERFIDPNSFAGGLIQQGAQGLRNESFVENVQFISTSGIVYNSEFSSKHRVNAQLMSESIRNKFRTFSATGFGINRTLLNTPASTTPGNTTNNFIPAIGGSKGIDGISSLFAIADYTYDRRFTISGSLRRDGSSRVPEKNRFVNLYSVGASWNLINERFMEDQNLLQVANLRASYGESANIDGFPSQFGFISTFGSASYAGEPAIVPTSPGDEDYRIETQTIANIGFDIALLKRRLRITADVYRKESNDLFANQGLSRVSGFNNLQTNAGVMENRGLDFSVEGDIVVKKNFTFSMGVNGGFLRNRITSLGLLTEIPQGTGIIRVGLPIGSHFSVGFAGVNPQTGLPVYEDINGNPTSTYSAANNRAAFGTFLPKFTGGLNTNMTIGNVDISTLFSTAQGVKRFNNESFFYTSTNSNIQFNKDVRMLTSWRQPGDITDYQKINSQRQFSSRDIQDASFIRFRNLAAGYTFKTNNAKSIRGFRLWGQAQNLFTWTKWNGLDPEENNNIAQYEFPNPRTYTIGLDINF